MFRRTVGDRLVMSPMEPLVAGAAAEAFERHLQQLYRGGSRHLVVDLSGVPLIDSAGIRAFVPSHTTAQRAAVAIVRKQLAATFPLGAGNVTVQLFSATARIGIEDAEAEIASWI